MHPYPDFFLDDLSQLSKKPNKTLNLDNVNISLTVSHRPCHAWPVRVSLRHCRIDFPKRELKR